MKKFFELILTCILVLSLFACGSSEPEDTTPITYTSGTYAMESYTKNGESLGAQRQHLRAVQFDVWRWQSDRDGTQKRCQNTNG